jgi:hypothetical protein
LIFLYIYIYGTESIRDANGLSLEFELGGPEFKSFRGGGGGCEGLWMWEGLLPIAWLKTPRNLEMYLKK